VTPLLDERELIEVEHRRYDIRVGVRAALFDVGDTLVEGWLTRDRLDPLIRSHLVAAFGERPWYDAFVASDLEPASAERQETIRWYEDWFAGQGVACDIELDRLRAAVAVPLDLVSTPVPGAADALRWCKAHGLRVVLVTNTLARGDAEVVRDWQRQGLADVIDGCVSSHDAGWRKPHRAIYERALALAGVGPKDAFMVGDDPIADVQGAQAFGLRAILRRTAARPLPPDVHPDAVIDDMAELPGVVTPWL
jgi:FMN phosphatase YigB (HAD superfamily)